MKHRGRMAAVLTLASALALPQNAAVLGLGEVPGRTQVSAQVGSIYHMGTPNEHESRPALSLAKLYLAYGVLRDGEQIDKDRVESMIRFSEDSTANYLDRTYPRAIQSTIDALV